jgi:hypothetical protein
MAIKKPMWILFSVFIIGVFLLCSGTQLIAETWNCKAMNKMVKAEGSPIPDAEGHWVGMNMREGVTICDNGEIGWHKVVVVWDGIKGEGTYSQYITLTLQDGSTITNFAQDKGIPGGYKWTGQIINGTGRFKGIKGTVSAEGKILPPENGCNLSTSICCTRPVRNRSASVFCPSILVAGSCPALR